MKPPRLDSASPGRAPGRHWFAPLALLLAPFLLAGGVHLLRRHGGPLPECGFHHLTGLPCAFCGSTRALDALGGGHPLAAFALNPLLVLAAVASVLGGGWLLRARRKGRASAPAPPSRQTLRLWAGVILALVLLNWAYLLCVQR